MTNVVIITAKAENASMADKNAIKIDGKPCISYGIEAGLGAKRVEKVFVYSDGEKLRSLGERMGAIGIDEPKEFTVPDANHGDAIRDAVLNVKENHLPDLGVVTLLLGNTSYITSELIDLSIEILEKNSDLDSVMSVWKAQDDHPYRALKIGEDGTLNSFLGVESNTARQSYPDVYFYDQGVWTFRWENVEKRDGPNPWWWMGKKSFPIVRNWVTGRDTHTQLDVDYSEYWLKNGHKDEIFNMDDIKKML